MACPTKPENYHNFNVFWPCHNLPEREQKSTCSMRASLSSETFPSSCGFFSKYSADRNACKKQKKQRISKRARWKSRWIIYAGLQ